MHAQVGNVETQYHNLTLKIAGGDIDTSVLDELDEAAAPAAAKARAQEEPLKGGLSGLSVGNKSRAAPAPEPAPEAPSEAPDEEVGLLTAAGGGEAEVDVDAAYDGAVEEIKARRLAPNMKARPPAPRPKAKALAPAFRGSNAPPPPPPPLKALSTAFPFLDEDTVRAFLDQMAEEGVLAASSEASVPVSVSASIAAHTADREKIPTQLQRTTAPSPPLAPREAAAEPAEAGATAMVMEEAGEGAAQEQPRDASADEQKYALCVQAAAGKASVSAGALAEASGLALPDVAMERMEKEGLLRPPRGRGRGPRAPSPPGDVAGGIPKPPPGPAAVAIAGHPPPHEADKAKAPAATGATRTGDKEGSVAASAFDFDAGDAEAQGKAGAGAGAAGRKGKAGRGTLAGQEAQAGGQAPLPSKKARPPRRRPTSSHHRCSPQGGGGGGRRGAKRALSSGDGSGAEADAEESLPLAGAGEGGRGRAGSVQLEGGPRMVAAAVASRVYAKARSPLKLRFDEQPKA
eukprot:tig00020830_g14507.t1